ncbi:Sulfiredoxin [Balamuthia mandrillaris]
MPMAVITRGLESVLDEQKVQSLMRTLQDAAQAENVPPIDVLWIQGSKNPQNNYYFAFGGCHRYEAHRRLKKDTIPAKLMKGTRSDLMVYLGSFAPLCE